MTSRQKKIGDIEMDTKYTNDEALQKLEINNKSDE